MITAPTIHHNGTSRQQLYDEARAAIDAVHKATKAFKETVPNGRDYYTQGPAALNAALLDWYAARRNLEQVSDYLEQLALAILDAPGPGEVK